MKKGPYVSQLTTEALIIAEKLSTADPPAPKTLKGLGAVLKNVLKDKCSEPLSTAARVEKENLVIQTCLP